MVLARVRKVQTDAGRRARSSALSAPLAPRPLPRSGQGLDSRRETLVAQRGEIIEDPQPILLPQVGVENELVAAPAGRRVGQLPPPLGNRGGTQLLGQELDDDRRAGLHFGGFHAAYSPILQRKLDRRGRRPRQVPFAP